MAERRSGEAEVPDEAGETIVIHHRPRPWRRLAIIIATGLLVLMLIAVIGIWIERRPIATHFLQEEFERRGVQASYHLDRIGLRTQEVSNLVIGNRNRPDLVARHAQIQMRLKWNGNFEVYRIVARGVRLRGRLAGGRVSWGEIDKMMPPPSNKPFALPNFVLDVADSSIALATPFGPLGASLEGTGRLSGGFKGRVALSSPRMAPGRCEALQLRANFAVSIIARHPHVEGPVGLGRFTCPTSKFDIVAPSFDAKAAFNEAFTNVDGSGRMAIAKLTAGANGLANFAGDLTYKGSFADVRGAVKLSAQNSRMATIFANRTALEGKYALGIRAGTFVLAGNVLANNAALDRSMLAGVTGPLAAAAKTPIGPIATAIGGAIQRTAGNFDTAGEIRVVNFPGGGGVRIQNASVRGPRGAQARIVGGSGVTYYWPASALRIDSDIQMGGGGLPNGRVSIRQPRPNAPINGVAEIAPYSAGGARLAMAPIRFADIGGGTTRLTTAAQLDGPISSTGRVQALRIPIEGTIGRGGSFAFGSACEVVSFSYLRAGSLQIGPTRLPVCPVGRAIIAKSPSGPLQTAGRINAPVIDGRIGSSPLHVAAAQALVNEKQFSFDRLGMRLGRPTSPILFNASHLTGSFLRSGFAGAFSGGGGTVGSVPLVMSEANGKWSFLNSDVTVDAATTVSDRAPDPRFYPLRSNDVHLTIAGDYVRANGILRHPATGTEVTAVNLEHRLSDGAGHATLDVPGIAFGPSLQPDDLTRLTEGVVALVNGTVRGQGRIDWASGGEVTSTGDFSTRNMDLAAPFGPVAGLSTSLHFTDLLNLETAPHQVATVATVNPGITVNDGVVHYQILRNNRVKIEQGEWPFMGGQLILEETILDFNGHQPKKLTFRLVGFDTKQFVDSLGFSGFSLSGIFDGELPMVFDENGGRIVGGVLTSRQPGGELKYQGVKPKGLVPGLAFSILSDIRYRSMVIRLDGDLAGEFATKVTIDQVSLGPGHGIVASLVHRAFDKLPLKLNLNINGPFRALIQTAKAFKDPTQVIAPVMPFPIDSPALKVEVLSTTKQNEPAPAPAKTPSTNPPPGGAK
ncbi:YdbH domain-containing protein [Sphingomonas sp.]|uniref:intermembrane phospholipid transport protein YdbH family protein n=1 Tax=Sphingomonas sp. TaxID=28214 RepID=UPI0025ED9BB4|nr:YdbH domain-containing protein [Sphingomonas sp.]MBV9528260.1 YdbH domain-containing protein [Sphingomonas sp.]